MNAQMVKGRMPAIDRTLDTLRATKAFGQPCRAEYAIRLSGPVKNSATPQNRATPCEKIMNLIHPQSDEGNNDLGKEA